MRKIISTFILSSLALASAAPAVAYQNSTLRADGPATGCTATSYEQVEEVIRSCVGGNISLEGINVPAGGQLKFSKIKLNTTVSSLPPYLSHCIFPNSSLHTLTSSLDHATRQNKLHPVPRRSERRQSPHHDVRMRRSPAHRRTGTHPRRPRRSILGRQRRQRGNTQTEIHAH